MNGLGMPSFKGFNREWEKRDAYTRARLEGRRHLPVVGVVERRCVVYCPAVNQGGLEWGDYADIEC